MPRYGEKKKGVRYGQRKKTDLEYLNTMVDQKFFIMHKIRLGWSDDDIIDFITDIVKGTDLEDKLPKTRVKQLITLSKNEIKRRYDAYAKDVALFNINRIEAIVNMAEEKGDYKAMLSAIDTLNKMANIYTQKVEVKNETPIFEIKVPD